MRTHTPPTIRSLRQLRRDCKTLGIKRPGKFAKVLYRKQFEKFLPHGGVRKIENAFRRGTLARSRQCPSSLPCS